LGIASGRFVSKKNVKDVVAVLKKSSAKGFYLLWGGAGRTAIALRTQNFFGIAFFQKSDRLLIPTVINNDRWYKPVFWRVAAPPAPRA
jgi:hypothetical protein